MPKPPKPRGEFRSLPGQLRDSTSKEYRKRLPEPPSKRRCTGAITAGGTSLKSESKACATHQHPRLRKADMVYVGHTQSAQCSAASRGLSPPSPSSVSAPQQVGPVRHACSAACSLQIQGGLHHVACAGLSNTDSEPPSAALRPRTVQILAPIHRICSHGACDMHPPERLSAAADPMKVMSSCRPILVISWNSSVLERANSSPSTNITCMALEPCHPPLVVPSRVQPSSHRCQNLVSQASHCAAQTAAS